MSYQTQAFRLCSVPDTVLNLSYESLTSREAKQAILSLSVSDPTVYAEIMGSIPSASGDEPAITQSIPHAELTDQGLEDDLDHTVEELSDMILASNSAGEAAMPLDEVIDFDYQPESDGNSEAPKVLPATTVSTTRSGRAPRLSSRYCGNDWVGH